MPDYKKLSKRYKRTLNAVLEKVAELTNTVIPHDHFDDGMQEILDIVDAGNRDTLIFVLGESRVGKSTLRRALCGILDARAEEEGRRRGHFSFSVAGTDGNGRFDWVTNLDRALKEEPLLDKKRVYPPIELGAIEPQRGTVSRQVEAKLHCLTVNMREERVPLIMDEANSIPGIMSRLQSNRALHKIKDLIEQSDGVLIAFGTMEMKLIVAASIQLQLRCVIVSLRAYVLPEKWQLQDDKFRIERRETAALENTPIVYGASSPEFGNLETSPEFGASTRKKYEPVDLRRFRSFLYEVEVALGPEFCDEGCMRAHAAEILIRIDGRCGKLIALVNEILTDSKGRQRVTWAALDERLDRRFPVELTRNLRLERKETDREIRAALSMTAAWNESREKSSTANKNRGRANPNAFKRKSTNDRRGEDGDV